MKTDLVQSCGHCLVFHICRHIESSTFTVSSFRIWDSSTGIPSPPLALFIVMLSKAHLTSHSRMSGSRWGSHHCDYLGHEDLFCTVLRILAALPELKRKFKGHCFTEEKLLGFYTGQEFQVLLCVFPPVSRTSLPPSPLTHPSFLPLCFPWFRPILLEACLRSSESLLVGWNLKDDKGAAEFYTEEMQSVISRVKHE